MQTQVVIDVDQTLKDQVSQKAREKGFSVSELTKLLYHDFVINEDPLIEKLENRMLDSSLQSPKIKGQLAKLGNMV